MNKQVEKMIECSSLYELGSPLHEIYIISTGKSYDGFWGKNGYNGIIIIGKSAIDDTFYNVNGEYEVDVVRFCDGVEIGGMDIPHDKNCVRVWFKRPVCFMEFLSSMEVMQCQDMKTRSKPQRSYAVSDYISGMQGD